MPIYDDLDDQNSDVDNLERCHRDFNATGNPLYAWEAWNVVRFTWRSTLDKSLDLPEWLAKYFDDCENRLLGWQPERVEIKPRTWGHFAEKEPPKRGEGPGAIGRALGFSEGLAKARSHWGGQYDDRERLALRVVDLMWSKRLSLEGAAVELNARGTSRASATRSVRQAARYALRRMQNSLRDNTGKVPARGEVVRAYSRLCKARAK